MCRRHLTPVSSHAALRPKTNQVIPLDNLASGQFHRSERRTSEYISARGPLGRPANNSSLTTALQVPFPEISGGRSCIQMYFVIKQKGFGECKFFH